MLHNFHRYLRR